MVVFTPMVNLQRFHFLFFLLLKKLYGVKQQVSHRLPLMISFTLSRSGFKNNKKNAQPF